ncbi:succinate dehydrogenase cytochrome b558 subunit [Bacillus massiliigorillae]|uniref:succinate dehydrogenase cytochrome b558 subunit n=1 Tax=Bacillus massiliigorillae TaxID=1243664 RepID=UPI0005A83457|nr:succinate dehydrogenase cytochrome b558 subunit [Bacillus massiliigorillae]
MAGNNEFAKRKLHSLLGVIPVGLFLVVHLTVNFMATKGEGAFNKAVEFMESLPYLIVLEVVLIFLPLLYHAIYGVYIAFTAKPNNGRFGFFRNWMFLLQRVTGILTFIFLIWHVWETRLAKAIYDTTLDFNMMADILSNPAMLAFYIVGVISAIFHFANGLWTFCITWGITVSPRSQRISTYVTMIIFVLLSVVGVMALLAFV